MRNRLPGTIRKALVLIIVAGLVSRVMYSFSTVTRAA